MYGDSIPLPPEAGDLDGGPFEPDDDWLVTAPKELQIEAMRRWFLDRFEDPANQTPWDGEDKEYVFIWGGPYDPNEEIQNRFGKAVKFETMWELITELWRDVGDDWAPIQHEGADYESYVSHLVVVDRQAPRRFFDERLAQVFALLAADGLEGANRQLLNQMAHSSLIAALEAYLADTMTYWVDNDDQALRRVVSTNKDFQTRSLTVAELFDRFERIREELKTYLADLVWHRLDKIKPMLASGLEIQIPDIGSLMREVITRHDIVHRAGRRADGTVVDISAEKLGQLRVDLTTFVDGIETELLRRFPVTKKPVMPDLLGDIF
jgi:hypothetical protein